MNIETVLQVWLYAESWAEFIVCCEQLQPQSFQVVLQLPPAPLRSLLETNQHLKTALVAHIASLPAIQVSDLFITNALLTNLSLGQKLLS